MQDAVVFEVIVIVFRELLPCFYFLLVVFVDLVLPIRYDIASQGLLFFHGLLIFLMGQLDKILVRGVLPVRLQFTHLCRVFVLHLLLQKLLVELLVLILLALHGGDLVGSFNRLHLHALG